MEEVSRLMSTRESRRMRLLDFSRGAQKLTQMVCSLFKARNFDGKDASSVTANSKEKLELEMGRRINRGVARSRRLGVDEGEQFGSCSWRSSSHEEGVKKVIRESLLLSSYDDEKASSSRSLGSFLRSSEFSSSYREAEESIRIKNSRRSQSKTVTPNLIARLMGLVELPAREPVANSAETKPKRCDNAPERVTLRSIIEREKDERCVKRLEADREAKFCSRAMQVTTTWGGGEEKGGLKTPKQLLKLEDDERLKKVEILKKKKEDRVELPSILKKKKEDRVELPSRMSRMHVSADCKQNLKRVYGRQSSDILSAHHRSRKVSAAPLPPPQAMTSAAISAEPQRRPAATASAKRSMESERRLAVNNSANTAKKTTGVTPAQKTSNRQEGGTGPSSNKQDDDDEPVINISEAAQQKQESLKSSNNEPSKKDPKSLCEIMPKCNKTGTSWCSGKSIDDDLSNAKRAAGRVNHLGNLLLNCHSFLLRARELSIDDDPARAANNSDAEAKLYLSCAEELLLRKRRHDRRELLTQYPLSAIRSSERALPLGDMVGYICDGIRKLNDYSEVGGGDAMDDLYVRLEMDLECKDVTLNAVWDEGWREGVGLEATAEVVCRVEQMVVTALVEEVAMQLMK